MPRNQWRLKNRADKSTHDGCINLLDRLLMSLDGRPYQSLSATEATLVNDGIVENCTIEDEENDPVPSPIAFIIYHGTEDGNREDCNVFHEEPEVYLDREIAEARKTELEGLYADVPNGWVDMKEKPVGQQRNGRWDTGE